jgi:hypothetical protein
MTVAKTPSSTIRRLTAAVLWLIALPFLIAAPFNSGAYVVYNLLVGLGFGVAGWYAWGHTLPSLIEPRR